jgi:hypothetical protein
LNIRLSGKRADVEDVWLGGGAELREIDRAERANGGEPFALRAEEVRVRRASNPAMTVTLLGKPAQVSARGFALAGERIDLDRGANRVWMDGPGSMTLPADQGPSPGRDHSGGPFEVTWHGKMEFDGQAARWAGRVEARTGSQRLSAETLEARLRTRVDFSQPPKSRSSVQLASVAAAGGVFLESRSADATGPVSVEWLQVSDLSVDQVSGAMRGNGPGWFRTVRRGGVDGVLSGGKGVAGRTSPPTSHAGGAPASGNPPPPSATLRATTSGAAPPPLTVLAVQFQRQLTGNLQERVLTLSDRVRATYGTAGDWQAAASPDAALRVARPDVVLTCDRLTAAQVDQSREGQRAPIELEARGSALVEGDTFSAAADRITYTEAKDLLVLEGTGRAPAELARQTRPGAPLTRTAAGRILYWRSVPRIEVDDWKFLNTAAPLRGAGGR